jgi:dsRNA-specific ribonuclease
LNLNFDTVVLDLLLDLNPNYNQGQLSLLKSAITCNATVAVIAVRTGLHLLFQHKLPAKQMVELQRIVAHQTKTNHLFFTKK